MLVNIQVKVIDNGYLVCAEYDLDISDAGGNPLYDTTYFASNFDAVRDQLALIGLKLQTATLPGEDA